MRLKTLVLDSWMDILEGEPERVADVPILHHYTDAAGLHGIVSSHRLWATAAQFSNDLSEIEYALTTACEVIEDTWKGRKTLSAWEHMLHAHLQRFFAAPFPDFNQSFLVSFCEEGDLLSQWRAYGHRSGFSLAFKLRAGESDLLRCEKAFRTLLRKVIYDPAAQRQRLNFLFKRLIKLVNGFQSTPSSDEKHGGKLHVELSLILILELTDWACSVKHNAFSEEREWRLISFTNFGAKVEKNVGVLVRPTPEFLIPYMVLRSTKSARLPIVEVRCGPSRLQAELARAATILLNKEGYGSVSIEYSKIPLRI